MTRSAILAVAFVLLASAAGSGDYALVLPGERDCAKSLPTCEAARAAITRGWLAGVPRDAPAKCEPSPWCFGQRSLYIPGFNAPHKP
jgi:hypothetical protein